MTLSVTLDYLVDKYDRRAELDPSDHRALLALPFEERTVEAGRYLVSEGRPTEVSSLILSGYSIRHKLTAEGNRQILSLHVPGDFVDLEGSLLAVADHNVQALSRSTIAFVAKRHVVKLIDDHPRLARAMWVDTLIDASVFREWVVNVGRRPARQRIAHILCEFARRLEVAGLGTTTGYRLPMTQEQIADCAGLTAVHVNRTLKQLEAEGLIVLHKRFVEIPDWEKLREMSDFNELYLHLEQVPGRKPGDRHTRGRSPPERHV